MICLELYHGQTLTVVVILFRGTSLKYFSDLTARLLACIVCVIGSRAGTVHNFLVHSAIEWGISIFNHHSGIFLF
jgi:hypothetical protein